MGNRKFLSWPGLSRPSTSLRYFKEDVDARHKAGHDELTRCTLIEIYLPTHFGGRFSEKAFGPST